MHQSCPDVLFLRDSQPSIHFPRSVYLSGIKIPLPGFKRFSFSAKKSSLHTSVLPPRRSEARSISSVKDDEVLLRFILWNSNIKKYYLPRPLKTSSCPY